MFFLPAFSMVWWHHALISQSRKILPIPKHSKHVNTGGMAYMDLVLGKEESSDGGLEFVGNNESTFLI
uniref:Putative ovule protein n=1 Tax=Solanum chacoense TaxID=4108 RepID=A0A0V0GQR1_SOLCH